jgi:hypothetical protein
MNYIIKPIIFKIGNVIFFLLSMFIYRLIVLGTFFNTTVLQASENYQLKITPPPLAINFIWLIIWLLNL